MRLIVLLFVLLSQLCSAQLSKSYAEASQDKAKIERFKNDIEIEKNRERKKIYQAALRVLNAKYQDKISDKKSEFVAGVKIIEELIEQKPNNVEYRWIRLTIQDNAPAILKYNSDRSTDLDIINKGIARLNNSTLKKIILDYIAKR